MRLFCIGVAEIDAGRQSICVNAVNLNQVELIVMDVVRNLRGTRLCACFDTETASYYQCAQWDPGEFVPRAGAQTCRTITASAPAALVARIARFSAGSAAMSATHVIE